MVNTFVFGELVHPYMALHLHVRWRPCQIDYILSSEHKYMHANLIYYIILYILQIYILIYYITEIYIILYCILQIYMNAHLIYYITQHKYKVVGLQLVAGSPNAVSILPETRQR